jgi:ankyrin repeat protein
MRGPRLTTSFVLTAFLWGCVDGDGPSEQRGPGDVQIYNAVREGDLPRVKQILANHPTLLNSQSNQYRMTPLHVAAHDGHLHISRHLVDRKCAVDPRDRDGATPLFLAAMKGHAEIVSLLIEHGADVNTVADERVMPLHVAAMNGHKRVVRILVEADAKIDAPDDAGYTPLKWAEESGDVEMQRLLRPGVQHR